MNYTPEIQAQFLAYLLHKKRNSSGVPLPSGQQIGVKLFPYFQTLDQGIFEITFNVEGFMMIISLIGRYYQKYSDLPTKVTYDQLKAEDKQYQQWFEQADKKTASRLKKYENLIFEPPQDIPYIQTQLLNFFSRSYSEQMIRKQREELVSVSDSDPYQIILTNSNKVITYVKNLENLINGGSDESYTLIQSDVSTSALRQMPGIETCFKTIRLYKRGMTVLVAPPKSFKTGLTQNICVDLLRRGKKVLWIDLENGLSRTVRRFYQNILNCPKEWIYSGVYVHEDMIDLPRYNTTEFHESGTVVYNVHSYTTGEKIEITDMDGNKILVDEYLTEARYYKALVAGATHLETDWEQIELEFDGIYEPFDTVLQRELDKIREETGGQIHIKYVKALTPSKLETLVESEINTENGLFSNEEDDRTVVIDWMAHARADNPKNYWEDVRSIYQGFKDIRDKYDLFMLGIAAMKNFEKTLDPGWSLKDLKTSGTDQVAYDVEALTVVLSTEEEQEKQFRRLVKAADRDDEPGLVEYIKLDGARQQAKPVDVSEHLDNCPSYWKSREGKRSGSTGSKQAKSFQFEGLSSQDLD